MSQRLEYAKGLYLEGIRDVRARDAITKYSGARYTRHSTGVRDGVEGFVEFFEPFLARNPKRDIQILRALEDGRHLFLHVYQSLNDGENEWVTTAFLARTVRARSSSIGTSSPCAGRKCTSVRKPCPGR